MPIGWEGEKSRLVPLDKARHFETTLAWVNDPLLTEWTLIGDFPLGRLAEEEFFEKHTQAKQYQEDIVFAVETLDGRHIGLTACTRSTGGHAPR